jgi:hypothetical protein
MLQTSLEIVVNIISKYTNNIFRNKLANLSVSVLNMFFGFFISTTLSTIPGQTGDWGIIGAAIIVTFYELASNIIYSKFSDKFLTVEQINKIKIGIIYGLFVDAFKLGS